MSNITREDRDALNTVLTITVAKEDYEGEFNEALKDQRKKVQLKGFRQGKAPLNTIRKMMGDRILVNLVNRRLSEDMHQYLEQEELRVLGRPIVSEDHEPVDITARDLTDYQFKFDVGLAPDFEIAGIPGDRTFTLHKVTIEDEVVDNEIQRIKRQHGTELNVEAEPQEGDSLTVLAREMDAAGQLVEGGIENEFRLFFNSLRQEIKDELATKKTGDTLQANIYELEESASEEIVHKYLLGLEAEQAPPAHPVFELTIQGISRIEPAELTPEILKQEFGEEQAPETEEEAREALRKRMAGNFDKQGEALLFREVQDYLLAQNQMELPDDFLQRWLASENEQYDPTQYPAFAEGLRWTLLRNKLAVTHNIQVTGEEVQQAAVNRIVNQFGNQPWLTQEMVGGIIQRMLSDEQEVDRLRDEVLMDKLYVVLEEQLNIDQVYLTVEEMNEKIREANERFLEEEE